MQNDINTCINMYKHVQACTHVYTIKSKSYYDTEKECRCHIDVDICIFCGKRSKKRYRYEFEKKNRILPYFIPHLK